MKTFNESEICATAISESVKVLVNALNVAYDAIGNADEKVSTETWEVMVKEYGGQILVNKVKAAIFEWFLDRINTMSINDIIETYERKTNMDFDTAIQLLETKINDRLNQIEDEK